jgi:hypothetical protein
MQFIYGAKKTLEEIYQEAERNASDFIRFGAEDLGLNIVFLGNPAPIKRVDVWCEPLGSPRVHLPDRVKNGVLVHTIQSMNIKVNDLLLGLNFEPKRFGRGGYPPHERWVYGHQFAENYVGKKGYKNIESTEILTESQYSVLREYEDEDRGDNYTPVSFW